MGIIKSIYRKIRLFFYKICNKIYLKRKKVILKGDILINGYLYVNNKGRIEIGKSFKANSGKNKNPIGGDTILRLISNKNGKIVIGDNCGISNSTFIALNEIKIGNNVLIGGGCKFWDNDFHSLDPLKRISDNDNDIQSKPIIVKDFAFIGGGSIILKGVTIGYKSIVAAGSVVSKDIPDGEIWGGNPAKFIRKIL